MQIVEGLIIVNTNVARSMEALQRVTQFDLEGKITHRPKQKTRCEALGRIILELKHSHRRTWSDIKNRG